MDVRPHWSFMGRQLVVVVAVLGGAIVAVAQKASGTIDGALAVVVVASLLWLVGRYARWATTVMILTNERLVQRRGVLGRRVRELPLTQIGEVDCRRRLRDRLLGSGDVVVTSVSQGREVFVHLPRPTGIVKELHQQMDRARRPGWDGPASMPDQLGKLEDLRRRGSISRAEFDAQRRRLLGPW